MILNIKKIEAALPQQKLYRLYDGHGLYIEIDTNGGKYWRFKYQFEKRERRISMGIYPIVSLAQAREKRDEARRQLAAGIDPGVDRVEKRRIASLNAENTFEAIAREWHELNTDRWTSTYKTHIIRRLELDIFPYIGKMPIAKIKPLHLLDVLRVIEKRGAGEVARRALQYCRQIFCYAIITERAERNSAVDLQGALKPIKHGHFAAIESDEIPAFLKALENNHARLFAQTRYAVKLLMLTFVRTSELIEATWDEFDLEKSEWVIPAQRMKTRRPHIVPLSKQALEILAELKKTAGHWPYVFPNWSSKRKHMSNNTILGAIKRLGYKGRMTGHGFRALAMSTIKEQLGWRHEVVDRQLAHAPANKVDAAYDRAKFLPDRRKMMQEWADYLDIAVKGESGISVHLLQAAE